MQAVSTALAQNNQQDNRRVLNALDRFWVESVAPGNLKSEVADAASGSRRFQGTGGSITAEALCTAKHPAFINDELVNAHLHLQQELHGHPAFGFLNSFFYVALRKTHPVYTSTLTLDGQRYEFDEGDILKQAYLDEHGAVRLACGEIERIQVRTSTTTLEMARVGGRFKPGMPFRVLLRNQVIRNPHHCSSQGQLPPIEVMHARHAMHACMPACTHACLHTRMHTCRQTHHARTPPPRLVGGIWCV